MMLFGFAGQLQSVHYPQNWVEVNDYLSSQSDCKALFLPWQQYYALAFNDYLVVGNTASSYFDCEVVSGKNMELGTISSQGGNGEAYDQVENAVISDTLSPEEVAEILKAQGIRFVIYTTDVIGTDPYTYDFLSSSTFQNRLQKEGIYLFEVF
jgi:hypothetical protein